jgi:hypothetical protein
MTDAALLEYGRAELAAFRRDMAEWDAFTHGDLGEAHSTRAREVARALHAVIRNQDERRFVAGLTREQAAAACRLAAEADA